MIQLGPEISNTVGTIKPNFYKSVSINDRRPALNWSSNLAVSYFSNDWDFFALFKGEKFEISEKT